MRARVGGALAVFLAGVAAPFGARPAAADVRKFGDNAFCEGAFSGTPVEDASVCQCEPRPLAGPCVPCDGGWGTGVPGSACGCPGDRRVLAVAPACMTDGGCLYVDGGVHVCSCQAVECPAFTLPDGGADALDGDGTPEASADDAADAAFEDVETGGDAAADSAPDASADTALVLDADAPSGDGGLPDVGAGDGGPGGDGQVGDAAPGDAASGDARPRGGAFELHGGGGCSCGVADPRASIATLLLSVSAVVSVRRRRR